MVRRGVFKRIMPPTPSRQELIQQYASLLNMYPGPATVDYSSGPGTKYNGLTWGEFYIELATAHPNIDPKALADAVLGQKAAARLTGRLANVGTGLANFVNQSGKAAANTNFAGPLKGPLQFASGLGFFTSSQFWVRAGEVLLGLALISVGTVKLAETSQVAQQIVKNTPVGRVARFVK